MRRRERRECANPRCRFKFSADPSSRRKYCVPACGQQHQNQLKTERRGVERRLADEVLEEPPATLKCYCGARFKAGRGWGLFHERACGERFIAGHYLDLADYQRQRLELAAYPRAVA